MHRRRGTKALHRRRENGSRFLTRTTIRCDALGAIDPIGEDERADIVVDDQAVTEFPTTMSDRRAFQFLSPKFPFTQEDFFRGSRLFRKALAAGYMKPLMRREFLRTLKARYDPEVLSGEDFLFLRSCSPVGRDASARASLDTFTGEGGAR